MRSSGRKRLFYSMRSRLVVSFGTLFIVVLSVLLLIQIYGIPLLRIKGVEHRMQFEASKELSLIADLKKERLLRWFEERMDIAHLLSQSEILNRHIRSIQKLALTRENPYNQNFTEGITYQKEALELNQHLNLVDKCYDVYTEIQIVDVKSGLIIASTNNANIGLALPKISLFEDFVPYEDIRFQLIQDSGSRVDFIISAQIAKDIQSTETTDENPCLLIMHIDPDDFIEPVLHTGGGLGETGEALMVNKDGMIITHLKHPLENGGIPIPLQFQITDKPAVLASRGKEGVISHTDYRNVPVLAAYRYIPISSETGWGMVVKKDKAEIFATSKTFILSTAAIGSLAVVAIVIMTYMIATSLSKPIRALTEVALKVKEGDLNQRAVVLANNEIGALTSVINSMIEKLAFRNRQLETANRELESFSYSVSHDLRAPLTRMSGFGALLERYYSDALDEKGKHYLDRILVSSNAMADLIDGLLLLSRISQKKIERKSINLSEMSLKIITELQEAEPARKANIIVQDGLKVRGDPGLILIMMQNLLNNAWKYSRREKLTRIEVGKTGIDGVEWVYVRDNGVGFNMGYYDMLFTPFQRLHSDQEFEGSGIGLATVQRVVNRHGGSLKAISEPGNGATFSFII